MAGRKMSSNSITGGSNVLCFKFWTIFWRSISSVLWKTQLFLLLLQIQKFIIKLQVPNFYPQPMSLHQRTWEMQISSILRVSQMPNHNGLSFFPCYTDRIWGVLFNTILYIMYGKDKHVGYVCFLVETSRLLSSEVIGYVMNILVEKCDHPMCFHSRDFTSLESGALDKSVCSIYMFVCVSVHSLLLLPSFWSMGLFTTVCAQIHLCVYSARTVKSIVRLTRILYCYDCKTCNWVSLLILLLFLLDLP